MKPIQSMSLTACAIAVLFNGCGSGPGGGGAGGGVSSGGSTTAGQSGSGGLASGGETGGGGQGSGGVSSGGSGGASSGGSNGNGGRGSGGATLGGSSGSGAGGASSGGGSGGGDMGGSAGGAAGGAGGSAGSGGGAGGDMGGSTGAGGTVAGGAGGSSAGGASGGSSGKGGALGGSSGAGAGGATVGAGGASAGGTTGKGGSTGSCSSDTCPAPNGGVTIHCEKRFMYGVNYAWSSFAGDFGGISAWSQQGVAGAKDARTTDLTDMQNNGVDIVRWWMYPDLGGDGVKLDSSKTPSGIGSTVVDDIQAALDIAKSLDIHIKLTLFSFDSFWNDYTDSGITFPSLQPIATDATKRAALISKVVIPIAQAVESSPNKDRMIAWDVINEPEWSITGSDPYGDQAFDPTSSGSNGKTMATVTFAQMETFVKDVVTALHANSSAPATVGSAAVKWAKAWSQVGLDFYDFHWYGWVDQYYPHTNTPAYYKVDDKPVVVGEFPLIPASDTTGQAFGGISYGKLLDDWFTAGYAGAQGWAFSDTSNPAFNWSSAKSNVKAWASAHTCYTHY